MPAYVTHSLFGKDVLGAMPNQDIKQFILQRPVPFEWGLQGPDLLFFNGTLHFARDHTLNRLGGLMHREQTENLFCGISESLLALKGEEGYENTLAYALGFCCHYSLDSVAHPFIYCMQERLKKSLPQACHRGVHNKLESDIDSEICRMKTGKPVHDFKVDQELVADSAVKKEVARLYARLLSAVYRHSVPLGAIERCFDEGYHVLRLVLDKPCVLQIACVLDFLAGKRNALSAHVRRRFAKGDVLNLAHLPWQHQRHGGEQAFSYPELEQQALERAVAMVGTLWNSQKQNSIPAYIDMDTFDNGSPMQCGCN